MCLRNDGTVSLSDPCYTKEIVPQLQVFSFIVALLFLGTDILHFYRKLLYPLSYSRSFSQSTRYFPVSNTSVLILDQESERGSGLRHSKVMLAVRP